MAMATSPPWLTSSLLPAAAGITFTHNHGLIFLQNPSQTSLTPSKRKRNVFKVQAAKLPVGVELPKQMPKFVPPFLGFTKTAEIWNSRACMIGLIGTFFVELILNKGILQIIGVEIGKGLDIPL